MSYDSLFKITTSLALFSWILLLVIPFRPITNRILIGVSVTLLCIVYAVLVYSMLQPTDFAKFNSLDGIISLLSSRGAALAGWIHYLAFDLMAGLFIASNAAKHGIGHTWLVPCLILTLMLGPVGLLLYFLIRWALTKHYFTTNY
jgi:hypothetical protein